MRKFVKAAASIAVGCAMLSTSAFAAGTLTGTVTDPVEGAFTATINGLGDEQSTILVLKGSLNAMPASILEGDIVYIDQVAAANNKAEYPVKVDPANLEAVTVFAGATTQSEASWIKTVLFPKTPSLPEGTTIEIRNASAYGLTGKAVVKVTGIAKGSVKVDDVDAYVADYTATGGIRQYLAIVDYDGETPFTADDIAWDENGTPEAIDFGNVNDDTVADASDSSLILQAAVKLIDPFSNKLLLTADVNADGIADASDSSLILQKAVKLIAEFDAAKEVEDN